MFFQFPALLGALLVLPGVWWLLRTRPPAPRTQVFPPIALLTRLKPARDDAATPPLWLLLLRLAAVALLILGLATPVISGRPVPLPGSGTLVVLMDNGLFSAADWPARTAAAHAVLDAAGHAERKIVLLPTAPNGSASPTNEPLLPPVLSAEEASHRLDALRSAPWAPDRARTAATLRALMAAHTPIGAVIYFDDGVATPGKAGAVADRTLAAALAATAPTQDIRFPDSQPMVLTGTHTPDEGADSGVMAQLITLPQAMSRHVRIRAHGQDGGTLAVTDVAIPADAASAPVSVALPTIMRNRVDLLSVDATPSAAATLLLDEGDRLRPVGLVSASASGDTPLVGTQFYLRRALTPTADLHTGTVASLVSQPLSVLIAPDGSLTDGETRKRVADWVRKGGTLIRFAGRTLAGNEDSASETDDTDSSTQKNDVATTLLPVSLMPTARQLGGAMSWGKPQPLTAFPETSPFHGLPIPKDVTVSRQVLARPAPDLDSLTWARLADGTPLVTHTPLGKGEVVLFHVTPTADWSNLPLSGLFVAMLERLVNHASGVDAPADTAILPPVLSLDGDGALGPPPPFARGLAANLFGSTPPSPEHPPGLYGSRSARRALNVGDTLHTLSALPAIGVSATPAGHQPDRYPGPWLLALGLLLLLIDAIWTWRLRGFSLGRSSTRASLLVLLLVAQLTPAFAQDAVPLPQSSPPPSQITEPVPQAALETRLAYVLTGNAEVDSVSREGLQGLSDYVNARTSAVLGHPDGVRPGKDDLAYYPLLYWPITPDAQVTPAETAALSTFMARGGMIVIDTQGVDPDTARNDETGFSGDAPGSTAALRRVTAGLPIPALARLDDHHVLSHTFYLLHDFPGRYAGQPVWVAREGEAENDDVSPVIIGSADWAHAWAVDQNGDTRFAVLPGGDEQRRTAYRFGVNAVIYALTGNYKADQVHVPAILRRLGE
ncbi:DUF4159 domain-containing protein [Acetobacter estunensis]|uniref:DUF4159 domain-containing protein n=1 Tax=Acetobacter estunensis TaxID=104097 RepID=UPI001C2DA863|nr:DUF4159 domain-containing protein [Acetobacter estunensis]MBV1838368.1 DUF4159 domain-containing protein [Acetobacter estunensis]